MNRDAVQHERGPRNSTLRKQMAMFINKDAVMRHHEAFIMAGLPPPPPPSSTGLPLGLDLSVPRINAFLTPSSYNSPPPSTITSTPPPSTTPHLHIPSSPLHHQTTILPPSTAAATTHHLIAVDAIRESAAQLLFMNVNFLKNLTPFTQLPLADQLLLFEESWREFFIMGIAEHLLPVNFTQLLFAYELVNSTTHDGSKSKVSTETMIREIEAFQDILNKFIQMRVDSNEYVYLRAIVLYKSELNGRNIINNNNNNNNIVDNNKDSSQDVITSTSDDSSSDASHNNSMTTIKTFSSTSTSSARLLEEHLKVKALETNAKDALAAYEQNYYGIAHQIRYKNLLALLPLLKLVSHYTIEELFFRRNIGHVPLLKLLIDLYMQRKN
jgi:nuclear receptor subfamily 2 group E member 1